MIEINNLMNGDDKRCGMDVNGANINNDPIPPPIRTFQKIIFLFKINPVAHNSKLSNKKFNNQITSK